MAAAVAYYALLSLAPLALVVLAVAGMLYGRDEAQLLVAQQIAQLMGENAASGMETLLESVAQPRQGVLSAMLGFALMLVGASSVFGELQADLDRIWRQAARKTGARLFVRSRLLAFGMVLAVGALLLASLVASAALSALGAYWFPGSPTLPRVIEFAVSFALVTGLFAMIYKILPTARIAWRDVWIGAAVTSALFWVGKSVIGVYLGHAAVASAFGAAGAVVVLIVWVYYSAQVFFLGAEFTREYALHHGSHQHDRRLRRPLRADSAANEDWGQAPSPAKSKQGV
jgi:membrane protein